MEGQLKGIREEANKENALEQVAEASLNEKNPWDDCHRMKGQYG